MAGPILLPSPVACDSLRLGQLLVDPFNPTTSSFLSTASPAHTKPFTQPRYKDLVSQDDHGHLISSLTGHSISPYASNLLLLHADQMTHTTLAHPALAFDALRADTAAQSYLRKMRNRPLYYVVGLQTLQNPTFKHAIVSNGAIAEAPTSSHPKIRIPMHSRRDSAMAIDDAPQEAVFGVELRKVMCHVGNRAEPHSLADIPYDWSYHMVDQEAEVQMAIGLGKSLPAAELRRMAGIEADEDFSGGESWDEGSDEEGLAGFASD